MRGGYAMRSPDTGEFVDVPPEHHVTEWDMDAEVKMIYDIIHGANSGRMERQIAWKLYCSFVMLPRHDGEGRGDATRLPLASYNVWRAKMITDGVCTRSFFFAGMHEDEEDIRERMCIFPGASFA